MKKVAINGFGRIERSALKLIFDTNDLEVVGINDLMSIENAVYLLQYDSNYGKYKKNVSFEGDTIFVGEKAIKYTSIRDIADLPWKDLEVDVVIESTGLFTSQGDAEKHILAGAKSVFIS